MKIVSMVFIIFSIITFRMCSVDETHGDVELTLSPSYTSGTLYLTPVITYTGDDPITFQYDNSIAWIDEVTFDGVSMYEKDNDEPLTMKHQSTLNKNEKRNGPTIEIKAEPGQYKVELTSLFYIDSSEGERQRFVHSIVQTIEATR
ncbi:hypothetical protein ACERII_04770 [Evansella sp. AB-rgal1]|uniref:hypothetical protein n=1 Tax=Evansella sp. AB-rgal1 TaxID=3242696 RepID=UPI00359DA3E1